MATCLIQRIDVSKIRLGFQLAKIFNRGTDARGLNLLSRSQSCSVLVLKDITQRRSQAIPRNLTLLPHLQNMMMDTNRRLTNHKLYCNVLHLPIQTMLADGTPVIIDTMIDSQITNMYQLITKAGLEGDGFGFGEYPTEKYFRSEIKDGHNFIVSYKESGKMIAAFSLISSKFFRDPYLTFADSVIFVERSDRGKGIGDFLFKHIVLISKQLGFLGIYTDTFSYNVQMIKLIESTPGFKRVGHLPAGGKMADGAIVATEIFFKDLRNTSEGKQ